MVKARSTPDSRQPVRPGAARQAKAVELPPVRPGYYRGDQYRPQESVGYLMRLVVEMLSRTIDARMAEHGLTDAQWRPLFFVSLQSEANASQLARTLDCDAGATTRLLDRLEDKGLLRRVRSTDDRRVQHLELTEDGRKAVAIVPYVIADVLNAHLSGLSRAEIEQLRDLLERILTAGGKQVSSCTGSDGKS